MHFSHVSIFNGGLGRKSVHFRSIMLFIALIPKKAQGNFQKISNVGFPRARETRSTEITLSCAEGEVAPAYRHIDLPRASNVGNPPTHTDIRPTQPPT